MSEQEVARLEELLARVTRNAGMPRASGSSPLAAAAPIAAPAYLAPAPTYVAPAYVAPAYVAPAYEATPAPAYVAPAPVYEPEAPRFQPEATGYTPEPPVAASAPASLDASVDDLLLEDPFPSVVPAPPPSYSDVLEDPIPLVSVTSARSHDEDISGVMVVSELSEEQPEELLEDDIVEMTSESMAPTGNTMDELNFEDEDSEQRIEEPPASSSRTKIAGTMDEALARAAEEIELQEGREVPLKTPPPESGPQEAMPMPSGIHAPLAPDIEELLEADILPKGGVNAALPTAEQLGQTIDLEEARGPHLELDHPPAPFREELPNEELEVTLPQREFGGGYADNLMPPPDAQRDLDQHRQRVGEDSVPPPPESLATYPSQQPAASVELAPVIVPAGVSTDSYSESVSTVTVEAPQNAELVPELLARPALGPTPVAKFIRADTPRPKTFLELLDSSLSLGA